MFRGMIERAFPTIIESLKQKINLEIASPYAIQQILGVAELQILLAHRHLQIFELVALSIYLFGENLHLQLEGVFVGLQSTNAF